MKRILKNYLRYFCMFIFPISFTLFIPHHAVAATFQVDRLDDNATNPAALCTAAANDCSLRGAIMRADINPGDDIIQVLGAQFTLTLLGANEDANMTGDLDILGTNGAVTIIGAGAASTIIQAGTDGSNGIDRVFHILSGAQVSISDLTVQHGQSGANSGGGIRNEGTLTISGVNIISNSAGNGATGEGGGIYNGSGAVLSVTDTTFANNDGIHGGALSNFGNATITSTTIDRNHAIGGEGGGISNDGGTLTVINSTITGNSADIEGGGISSSGTINLTNVTVAFNGINGHPAAGSIHRGGGTFTIRNTIISNTAVGVNCTGTITSASGNLSSDSSCLLGGGNIENADPLLGPLTNNGGPTETHAFAAGSPAIDHGTNGGLPPTDQRGYVRIWDGDGNGSAIVDVGSYEYGAPPYIAPSIPTMNEWGMIIFVLLAGLGSVYYLRRQKRANS